MTGTAPEPSNITSLRTLLSDVIAPVLCPRDASALRPDLPQRAIEVLDGVGDLEARWDEISRLADDPRSMAAIGSRFAADDRVVKRGRTIAFHFGGERSFAPPAKGAAAGLGITLKAEGSLALEFRSGAEKFDDPVVHKRFLSVAGSLPRAAATDILAAAVLPQTSALLGVNTPLKATLMGFPFSLRFGVVVAHEGRLRFFAAGPIVKEIPL